MKKKYLLFAATAAMMLASCSSEVDFTQESLQQANAENAATPVEFGTYLGNSATTRGMAAYSKGTIANATDETKGTTDLKSANFGVFAYFTQEKDYRGYDSNNFDWTNTAGTSWKYTSTNKYPNFMYNEKIYWSGETADATNAQWIYDVVKYWPNGTDTQNTASDPSNTAQQKEAGKLSFFAFAPYTVTPTGTYSGDVPSGKGFANTDVVANTKTAGVVAMTTNTANSNVWVKYLMPNATANEAIDLLWGLRGKLTYNETTGGTNTIPTIGEVYNENLTKQDVTTSGSVDRVKFLFKHALAKIGGTTISGTTESTTGNPAQCGFKVVVDIDQNTTSGATGGSAQGTYFSTDFTNAKTLVTLKDVRIQDGASAASDVTVTTVTTATSDLNSSGWFNIEEGVWANGAIESGSTGATYNVVANNDDDLTNTTYRLNEQILEIGAKKNGASGDGKELESGNASWSTSVNPVGVTTTPTPLFANETVPGLLLIPGSGNTIYVTVDYFVRTADPKLAAGFSEVEQVITNSVSLASLDPNKYYTIIIHLGLTSVKFEAVVADWATSNNGTWDEYGAYTEGTGATENTQSIWLPSNVVK